MEHNEERQAPTVLTSDTDNATKIEPNEAPQGEREKYRRFRAYNTNMWNGPKRENTEQFHRQDDLHRFDSIASSLRLSQHQKKTGREILDRFDSHEFGRSIDHIIFGICVIVANRDVDDGSRYYPNPEASGDDRFEEIAETFGFDRGTQVSVIEKVRSAISG